MQKRGRYSWPVWIAAKLILGLGTIVLGAIFGAALLLQAILSDRGPNATETKTIDELVE